MSKSKIVGMMVLIAFAMGIFLVNHAVAGEKTKGRIVWYMTKWQQFDVPGEENHFLALAEYKGIGSNTEGKAFGEGTAEQCVLFLEIDRKTGTGSFHGYHESIYPDGSKIYYKDEGRLKGEKWEDTWSVLRGTGKYEGIKGGGTSYSTSTTPMQKAPMQSYADWDGEFELPR